ncbi:MAG: HU family DNA-binding protein [Bryobacteraceae bacterium]|nr:HU family DNA-binding protein [Bryobacterales bacterium]MEB2359770.1 HU family DNA-binding protein [Bryobacterales bacterium]NUM99771.1 HU family DNA-binding protein [Bryobacteraceae bacterium]
MKKDELAQKLARQTHLSKAKAADELDRVVHDMIRKLKKGYTVALPGIGTLQTGNRDSKRELPTKESFGKGPRK